MEALDILSRWWVVAPSIGLALWWRTKRIGSAHRKIAELQREVDELKKFKKDIEALRTKNPYEWLIIKNAQK